MGVTLLFRAGTSALSGSDEQDADGNQGAGRPGVVLLGGWNLSALGGAASSPTDVSSDLDLTWGASWQLQS